MSHRGNGALVQILILITGCRQVWRKSKEPEMFLHLYGEVKNVNFALEQAMEAQRKSRGKALLFL